jgi:peroxiredoxin
MHRRLFHFAVAIAGTFGSLSVAGEFNTVRSVGDDAPAWSKLPGVDGKEHSLADLKDKKVVVVVFTCNSCPAAVAYEHRISELPARHRDIAVVAINVNTVAEDNLEAMKARAAERKFPFAYLYDQTQKIAKDYGAAGTPEFFVLSPQRKIVYMGAMDDEEDPAKVKQRYVEDAIAAALAGKAPAVTETYAPGCRIRWTRPRVKRD